MPVTKLDNRNVKRLLLDGRIVRKAYYDSKLCHVDGYKATIAAYGYRLDVDGISGNVQRGFYVEGSGIAVTGRSYRVTTIDANNAFTHSRVFDTCGSTNEAIAMAAYLNAIPNNTIVLVYSHDEPQINRLTGGLQAAMERCGAGAVFSSSSFFYRGAYVLIGKAGVGKSGGYEAYGGSTSDSRDAKVAVDFSFMDGVVSDIIRKV